MPYMLKSSMLKWSSALFFLVVCAGSGFAETRVKSDCQPSFPFAQGWFGADAAYSIPLADGRDVWIFGDTLYGKERKVVGNDPTMVHNTIGISTCKNGQWKIDYSIKRDAKGESDSFFKPPSSTVPPSGTLTVVDNVMVLKLGCWMNCVNRIGGP